MKNLFFYKLYLFDKRLFFLIAVFSGLTILCNIKGDEITPFFIWAMYSEKENMTNKYEIFRIQVNGSTLVDYTSGYTDNNRFFLSAPLSYYYKIKLNNFKEPTLSFIQKKLGKKYNLIQPLAERIYNDNLDTMQFTEWYIRYLQQSTGKPIHNLQVDVLTSHFAVNESLQTDSSYLLIQWKQP